MSGNRRQPPKNTIARRDFLRGLGAGAALAGTLFDSPVAMGQTETAPVRVLFVTLGHGWGRDREHGTFGGSGDNFTLPAPLDSLEPIREHCTFVDGLRGPMWGNEHLTSCPDMFTASVAWEETSSAQLGSYPEPVGPSIDWAIAEALGVQVLRMSAGFEAPMCFNGDARLQPPYPSAAAAYSAIIEPLRQSAMPVDLTKVAVRDALFNYLGRDTDRMLRRVSGTERLKLEGYVDALDDLSRRISGSGNGSLSVDQLPPTPPSDLPFDDDVGHMLELIRLSFMADTHRVAVLGLGQRHENYPWTDENGVDHVGNIWGSDFHEQVAHYKDKDGRLAYEGWARWYIRQMIDFVQELARTPDVDGRTLLDNTLIVLTGEVEHGNHGRLHKLHTVVGHGGGLQGGRLIQMPAVDPRDRQGAFIGGEDRAGNRRESGLNHGLPVGVHTHADLFVSIARLCGVNMQQFGLSALNAGPVPLV